jgi:hypothetical protein
MSMSIKGKGFLGSLAVVALLLQGTASAQATFTSTSGKVMTISSYAGDLFVKWNESGLAPGSATSYTIAGTSTAMYACTTTRTLCQASALPGDLLWFAVSASANGTIRQSVAVPVPGAGSCTCSSGSLVLYSASYGGSSAAHDLQICDETNPGVGCATVGGGYFSQTFCKLNSLVNCPPAS